MGAGGVIVLGGHQPTFVLFLASPHFSRRQVLWSFSGAKIAASKADEAAGLSPGNEDNEAGGHFGPEKPCCPSFTEGINRQQ